MNAFTQRSLAIAYGTINSAEQDMWTQDSPHAESWGEGAGEWGSGVIEGERWGENFVRCVFTRNGSCSSNSVARDSLRMLSQQDSVCVPGAQ